MQLNGLRNLEMPIIGGRDWLGLEVPDPMKRRSVSIPHSKRGESVIVPVRGREYPGSMSCCQPHSVRDVYIATIFPSSRRRESSSATVWSQNTLIVRVLWSRAICLDTSLVNAKRKGPFKIIDASKSCNGRTHSIPIFIPSKGAASTPNVSLITEIS